MIVVIMSLIMIILLMVLLGWTWHSLGSIQKSTKILCIIGGLLIVFLITFTIYNISKAGINYENKETMKSIRIVFVLLFTVINSYILLPYIFRKLDLINNDELKKEQLIKCLIIIAILIIIIGIFEISYLESTQQRILSVINNR